MACIERNEPVLYYRKLKEEPRVFIPDLHVYASLDLWGNDRVFAAITRKIGVCEYIDYEGYLEKWAMCPLNTELIFTEECFEDKKEYTAEEVDRIINPCMYFDLVFDGKNKEN